MNQSAQRLAGWLVAPNGLGPRQKIRLWARGGDESCHDLILLGDLDFFSGGEPARNHGPLFRHLLNLPLAYFQSRRVGDSVARVGCD